MKESNLYFEFDINVNIFKAQGVLTQLKVIVHKCMIMAGAVHPPASAKE